MTSEEISSLHREAIDLLTERHQQALNVFHRKQLGAPDRHIFHYTNDVGFFEIIKSGKLWMSDYTTLNDPSELRYGLDVGIAALKEECERRWFSPLLRTFFYVFESLASHEISDLVHAFVLSLSDDANELTQWRSYGDNGRGYCIGFDSAILDQAFEKIVKPIKNMGYGSFYVMYDTAALREVLDGFCRDAAETVFQLPSVDEPAMARSLTRISVSLLLTTLYAALQFKHPAYKSEREFRYIILTSPSERPQALGRRARQNRLIEYLDLDWKQSHRSALRSVKIGPAANHDISRAFIADTLRLHFPAVPRPSIEQCSIPYRA